MSPTPSQRGISVAYRYPVYTVVVFKGRASAVVLSEYYRVHFEATPEGLTQAKRFARTAVTRARTNWQTGARHTMPCASIFENSPSRGLGERIGEYTSRARARFLRAIAESPNPTTR